MSFKLKTRPTPPDRNHFNNTRNIRIEDGMTFQELAEVVGNNRASFVVDYDDYGHGETYTRYYLSVDDPALQEDQYLNALRVYNVQLAEYEEWERTHQQEIVDYHRKQLEKETRKKQKEIESLEKQLSKLKKSIA
jgi:Ni/Co efflux regulator RcnB